MSRKINRTIFLLGILVLVLVLPLAARAEDTAIRPGVRTREELRLKIQEKQQELLARYRERLERLTDAGKRTAVERMNNRICTLNQNRVKIMNQHLDRMLLIVKRIEEKAGELKTQGKDVGAVVAATEKARTAIDNARLAVETQGERECSIEISGVDAKVGAEVRNAVSRLEGEIKTTRSQVTVAREAVSQAIEALAAAGGVK